MSSELIAPDTMFWLILAVKAGLTALVVIAVTVAAERGGPLAGAFLATLPIVPGPVFVLLALDHTPAFISDSAKFAIAGNTMSATFGAVYVVLAQRHSLWTSVAVAVAVWCAGAVVIAQLPLTRITAPLLTFSALAICYVVTRPYREAVMPRVPLRFADVLLRGLLAATIATVIFVSSAWFGPSWTGVLAVFPVMFGSIVILLHPRVGGHASASVIASANIGMWGFTLGATAAMLAAVPLGSWIALGLALATSLAWNLTVYGLRHRRMKKLPLTPTLSP